MPSHHRHACSFAVCADPAFQPLVFLPPDGVVRGLFSFLPFRWDDDVVFKNCAKGIDDQKKDKRFVNDTLRSEFHKKFMEKYIK